jgi:hypothetical protein
MTSAPSNSTDALTQRVDALEQRVRRQHWCMSVLGCAALGAVLAAGRGPTTQDAPANRALEGSSLRLTADDGRAWAVLDREGDAAALRLRDGDGDDRAVLRLDADGAPRLEFRYAGAAGGLPAAPGMPDSTVGVELSLMDNATPRVVMYDRASGERAKLLLMPDGSPMLLFKDAAGATRVEMLARHQGIGGLVYFDDERRLRGLFGYRPGAASGLGLIDELGRLRLELGLADGDDGSSRPFARMRNAAQEDVWRVPMESE